MIVGVEEARTRNEHVTICDTDLKLGHTEPAVCRVSSNGESIQQHPNPIGKYSERKEYRGLRIYAVFSQSFCGRNQQAKWARAPFLILRYGCG